MSEFEKFKAALEALCVEHGFMLCSTGYDYIQARKITNSDLGDEVVYGGLEEADW